MSNPYPIVELIQRYEENRKAFLLIDSLPALLYIPKPTGSPPDGACGYITIAKPLGINKYVPLGINKYVQLVNMEFCPTFINYHSVPSIGMNEDFRAVLEKLDNNAHLVE